MQVFLNENILLVQTDSHNGDAKETYFSSPVHTAVNVCVLHFHLIIFCELRTIYPIFDISLFG